MEILKKEGWVGQGSTFYEDRKIYPEPIKVTITYTVEDGTKDNRGFTSRSSGARIFDKKAEASEFLEVKCKKYITRFNQKEAELKKKKILKVKSEINKLQKELEELT